MPNNNWDEQLARMNELAQQFTAIQKKALSKVNAVIAPRLAEAAPVKVSEQQGGNSLPPGALKASIRRHVHISTGDGDPTTASVDFGKLSYIENFVYVGHRPPHARALTRSGLSVSGKNTPAHPFVRAVQDSSSAAAQQAYEETMMKEINRILNGE